MAYGYDAQGYTELPFRMAIGKRSLDGSIQAVKVGSSTQNAPRSTSPADESPDPQPVRDKMFTNFRLKRDIKRKGGW
jgi:hypothetical protein